MAWNELYNSDGSSKNKKNNCYSGQMFYCNASEFNNYCTFLFNTLFKVRSVIGDVDREMSHKRYCAFLGERLLTTYILANHCNVLTSDTRYNESIVYYLMRKIGRTLKMNRNSRLYISTRKLIGKGKGSSWR